MTTESPQFRSVKINRWSGGENEFESKGKITQDSVSIYTNSSTLENDHINIDFSPPLPDDSVISPVFLFNPETKNGIPQPSRFDAGQTMYVLQNNFEQLKDLGITIDHKRKLFLNYCTRPNAWFDPMMEVINICQGLGPDGDVPVHEWGHSDLFKKLQELGTSRFVIIGRSFHEYYADMMAITTNKDWQIGETACRIFGVPVEAQADGLRNPMKATILWSENEANLPSDPYTISLIFSGTMARLFKALTDKNLPDGYRLTEGKAFLLLKALVSNQPNFLLNHANLTRKDFYWSLIGSLYTLQASGILKKIYGDQNSGVLYGFLNAKITGECVRSGLITSAEALAGSEPITSAPIDLIPPDVTEVAPKDFTFIGGNRRFEQQMAKIIFEKGDEIVNSAWVKVVGHGVTHFIFDNDPNTIVTRFDGVRRLGEIDFTVEVDRNIGMPVNFVTPQTALELLIKDLSDGNSLRKAISNATPDFKPGEAMFGKIPDAAREETRKLILGKVRESTKDVSIDLENPPFVMIDGNNSILYEIPLGPFTAYIDMRTGSIDYHQNLFID